MVKRADIPAFGNLQGVKVVVSAVSTAGPFAGELFAENGADVIWLEPPKGLDPFRWTQDGWGAQNEHRNMRNLMLDVVSPEGHEVFLKVIEDADIFIEASRGGQWEKWGYPDELLWEHNPKLVIGHMSGYGRTGDPDYVSLPGYDFTVNAFSGLMYLNGYKDGPPYMIQKFVTDYYAGLFAYGSALAAYINALRTGTGESFDLAQFEAAVRCQAGLYSKWFDKQVRRATTSRRAAATTSAPMARACTCSRPEHRRSRRLSNSSVWNTAPSCSRRACRRSASTPRARRCTTVPSSSTAPSTRRPNSPTPWRKSASRVRWS